MKDWFWCFICFVDLWHRFPSCFTQHTDVWKYGFLLVVIHLILPVFFLSKCKSSTLSRLIMPVTDPDPLETLVVFQEDRVYCEYKFVSFSWFWCFVSTHVESNIKAQEDGRKGHAMTIFCKNHASSALCNRSCSAMRTFIYVTYIIIFYLNFSWYHGTHSNTHFETKFKNIRTGNLQNCIWL